MWVIQIVGVAVEGSAIFATRGFVERTISRLGTTNVRLNKPTAESRLRRLTKRRITAQRYIRFFTVD